MPQRMHSNQIVDRLVRGCAEVAAHLDLFEDASVVMNLLRDGVLSDAATAYVFRYVNGLADRNEPLVEPVLEVLASNAHGVAKAESELTGRALSAFASLLVEWRMRRR